ncbi:MAG: PD-(D/E)XK nuclease-like domain-containing protein [Phycisphaerales bacterium]
MTLGQSMTYQEYDSLEAVRWSTLKQLDGGPDPRDPDGKKILFLPEEYRHYLKTGGGDSDALSFGRLFHVAVLEPDLLPMKYVFWPDTKEVTNKKTGEVETKKNVRGTKEYKEFVRVNAPKEVVTASDYRRALAVRDAVNRHPQAKKLLARKCERETVVTWTDKETGLDCKCRIDLLLTDRRPCIVDAKSTKQVDDHAYKNTIARFGYHGQAGFYRDGVKTALDLEVGFKHIVVKSTPPHIVRVVTFPSDLLWKGSDLAHDLLEKLAEFQAMDEWPVDYPNDDEMELPRWYGGDEDWESGATVLDG